MFHGHSPLGGRPNTNLGDHGTLNARNHWFILFYSCVRTPHEYKIIEVTFG